MASRGSSASTAAVVELAHNGGLEAEEERDKASRWPFIEPEPIRENYVQNAVKFLSHPKVISSPISHRRSFLERKGLSKEEINEAFQRVPDVSSNKSIEVSTYREGQSNDSQIRLPTHSTVPQNQTVHSDQKSFMQQPVQAVSIFEPVNPTNLLQIFAAVGLFSAVSFGTCAFVMMYLIRKFKKWLHKVILEQGDAHLQKRRQGTIPGLALSLADAVTAANALAAAAIQVAAANQDMIKSQNEDLQHLSNFTTGLESIIKRLCSTVSDVESIVISDHAKESSSMLPEESVLDAQKVIRDISLITSNGVSPDAETVQQASAPSSTGASRAPYSASYMEILSMLERGEKPPGIKEVNDKPPNPNQPPSSSRLQPRPKPWQVQAGSHKLTSECSTSILSSFPFARKLENDSSAAERANSDASWLQQQNKAWLCIPPTTMPGSTSVIRYSKVASKFEPSSEDASARTTDQVLLKLPNTGHQSSSSALTAERL